ncbi:MAG: bacillithiol system redox-active protein YtxJ [Bacteroidetes bacterium]|nr:bacillithiol system redox-active protein YtxJ [Bacteroidota bacterium]MDA0859813.1 bacillithiol system redox-active protein YtxJ [Bacteroidota bacterium]MDA1317601.1 bacillithiol system redox-active protein YtxJ [Bacteroidota bacterium]
MGLFDSFLSNNSNNWHGPKLENIDQLNTIVEASFLTPQLIFKHSTRCSVSRFVLNEFKSGYSFSEVDFTAYFLDLLRYREISNAVAQQFDVVHQSPQLLIIKNGKAVAHASHENVNKIKLTDFLN